MATIHISETEAAQDFAGLLSRVRSGAEVVIDAAPDAVKVSLISGRSGRLLSESIALAEAHAEATGDEPTLDPEYAADVKAIIDCRRPRDRSAWA